MGLFESALRETLERVPDRLEELSALIDPAWIAQALAASGKASMPRQLAALLAQSRDFVLPPRRTERSVPRVVKKRASKFPTKKMPVSVN